MHRVGSKKTGFTLVELLVVIGIIALLISILLPTLSAARESGNVLKCASNLRQLGLAMTQYANQNKGKYPPGYSSVFDPAVNGNVQNNWFDADRIGRYLPNPILLGSGTNEQLNPGLRRVAGAVMTCPTYFNKYNAVRCYATNQWSCSGFNSNSLSPSGDHPAGRVFKQGVKNSSEIMLMTETFALNPVSGTGVAYGDGNYNNPNAGTFVNPSGVTNAQMPAQQWGAGTALWTRSGMSSSSDARTNVAWFVHRGRGDKKGGAQGTNEVNTPYGRVNMCFADGHVELISSNDVADFTTNKSKFRVLWSTKDRELQPN